MPLPDVPDPDALYRALARIAPDPVIAIDAANTILWVNAATERTFGYAADELIGHSLLTLIPERLQARHSLGMARYIATGERRISWERVRVPVRARSGDEIPVEITFAEFTPRTGGERTFVGFLRDVTERVTSEQALRDANALLEEQATELELRATELEATNDELRRANDDLAEQTRIAEEARADAETANRAKAEFLATMSHELRTPLNAISGYADLLLLGIRGPITEEQREDIERIRRSGQYLLGLINDVLNFAKLEAGQVPLELRAIPMRDILDGLEDLVRPQADAKELRLVQQDCATDAMVRADPEKVRQILLNLLTNAVKFTDAGGEIVLRCDAGRRVDAGSANAESANTGSVSVEVQDTGRGIPAAELPRIFDPFVQVDRELTAGSQQGVGLGLAISRDLARAMGGDLTVRSQVGTGTTFTLRLPAA